MKRENRLPERIIFHDQKMQLLHRSESSAMFYKLYQDDSINFAVGLIFKLETSLPDGSKHYREELMEKDLVGNQITWTYDDHRSALKQYRKLVKKYN